METVVKIIILIAYLIFSFFYKPAAAKAANFFIGMLKAGMKAAISGLVIGCTFGIIDSINVGNFWEGVIRGAVYGFVSGFITGMLFFCVSQAIGAIVNAANKAKIINAAKAGNYEKIAKLATHNPKAKKVVIGKYDNGASTSYVNVAKASGATYFEINPSTWAKVKNIVGDANMWKINEAFLRQQIALNKVFYVSHALSSADVGTYFWFEIQYLLTHGITIY